MKIHISLTLQLLTNVCVIVDVVHSNRTSSDKIREKSDLLTLIPSIVTKLQWRNLLIITDYSDPIFLSTQLSQIYVQNSITRSCHKNLTRSLQNFNKQSKDRIIMWCSKPCLKNKMLNDNLFDHRIFWLLVYVTYDDFTNDFMAISEYVRPDSQIYAVIPDYGWIYKWLLVTLKPNLQYYNKILLKTIAHVHSDNDIHWLEEKQESFHSLKGYNFTAMMFHWSPMSEVVRSVDGISMNGVNYNLMLIFSDHLGFNFTYDIIYAKGEHYDNELMTVWNLQRQKLRYKQITMSGMFMPVTHELSHSSFIISSRCAVIINNIKYDSQSEYNIFAYSKPFTFNAWICIFVTAAICIVLSFISSACSFIRKRKFRYFHYCYDWISLFVRYTLTPHRSQGLNFVKSPTTSKKIFSVVLLLFTALVSCNYESLLIAFLAAEQYKIPFETLEDIINDGRFKVGTSRDSEVDLIISNAKTGVLTMLKNESMYETYTELDEAEHRIFEENFAAVIPIEYASYLNCSFAFLKTTYIPLDIAVNFPKNSPYVEIFSKFIMRMRAAGILRKVVGNIMSVNRPQCAFASNEFNSVQLTQSLLPFLILCTGIIIAFLIFVVEVVLGKIITK